MEIRHLELLRELRDRGSLAAVARATHRTPSALSQQLRTAERELGVQLVEPVSRGIRLTSAGELLAEGASDIMERLAALRAELDASTGEPRGTVSVMTLSSAAEPLLPGLVQQMSGTAITLELSDFLSMDVFAPRTSDADVVIGHTTTGPPADVQGLNVTLLAQEPLDVAVPPGHPLAGRDELTPEDVAAHPWVGAPEGYPFDAVPAAVEQATGRPVDRRFRLRDNRTVEVLVAEGAGLGVLPRFSARIRPEVRLIPLTGVRAERAILALSRAERYVRQAVQTVTEALRREGERLQG